MTNRDIKFRAWDEDGYMFTPFLIEFMKNGGVIVWEDEDTFGTVGSGVIALMQYTGLKDKNGKEIYEGDILQSKDTYGKPFTEVVTYEIKKQAGFLLPMRFPNDFEWEVIGNIYENPELQ